MHVARPTFKYEMNLTTLTALLGIVISIWSASARYNTLEQGVEALDKEAQSWRANHLAYHNDRSREINALITRQDESLKEVETRTRDFDRMEYRLQLQEQGTTSLSAAVAELRQAINDQAGDVKLIREIVQRLDDYDPPKVTPSQTGKR